MTPDDIARLFTFHPPEGDEQARYQRITAAARNLADEIVAVCPAGPETTIAIRSVMRARMDANAAIAVRKRDGSQPLPEIDPMHSTREAADDVMRQVQAALEPGEYLQQQLAMPDGSLQFVTSTGRMFGVRLAVLP